jgi:hydrogenase 3 maturation protease
LSFHWKKRIEKRLGAWEGKRVIIAGVGNRMRGDDAAGSIIAAMLSQLGMENTVDCGSSPENYCEAIAASNPEAVVVIDAALFGGAPGEARILKMEESGGGSLSTHDPSLELFSTYIKDRCGCEMIFVGIQPRDTSFGGELSRGVADTLDYLVRVLCCNFS